MKGLIVRNFRWWLEQKIFDRDGILTIGYCYPQMYMAERYNAPGSPYWGMKSFILLALPDDHPFWAAQAEPMPALDALKPMPHANMLVARRKGRVTAYAAGVNEGHGHGQFPEKYAKFAYDTRFGFCASRSREVIWQAAPDSMLAFVIDDNVFVRKVSLSHEIRADRVVSKWSPFPGITVTTTILPTGDGHRRRHEIDSAFPCEAYDCGFAVPSFAPGYVESTAAGTATARNAAVSCTVSGQGEGAVIKCDPNVSLYSSRRRSRHRRKKRHTKSDGLHHLHQAPAQAGAFLLELALRWARGGGRMFRLPLPTPSGLPTLPQRPGRSPGPKCGRSLRASG